jgi:hypothetical protein
LPCSLFFRRLNCSVFMVADCTMVDVQNTHLFQESSGVE